MCVFCLVRSSIHLPVLVLLWFDIFLSLYLSATIFLLKNFTRALAQKRTNFFTSNQFHLYLIPRFWCLLSIWPYAMQKNVLSNFNLCTLQIENSILNSLCRSCSTSKSCWYNIYEKASICTHHRTFDNGALMVLFINSPPFSYAHSHTQIRPRDVTIWWNFSHWPVRRMNECEWKQNVQLLDCFEISSFRLKFEQFKMQMGLSRFSMLKLMMHKWIEWKHMVDHFRAKIFCKRSCVCVVTVYFPSASFFRLSFYHAVSPSALLSQSPQYSHPLLLVRAHLNWHKMGATIENLGTSFFNL